MGASMGAALYPEAAGGKPPVPSLARRASLLPWIRMARLSEQRRDLPDNPGVYLFRDARGKVIYVGKAKSIKKRVASHFSNSVVRGDVEMRDLIDDIQFVTVNTEAEAL